MPTPSISKLTPLEEATAPFFVGVDVGGTNIKVGIVDDLGRSVAFTSIPTEPDRGAESAATRVADAVAGFMEKLNLPGDLVLRLGLATPGPMDVPAGMLLKPGNLPAWHDTPIREMFARATGLAVTYANDANAAAWGEYWCGAGAQYHSMVLITLGTGVGGGIVIGDLLVEGVHSCGAEIGHIIIDSAPDAPNNSLGIRGTLEGYCGSYGIIGQATRLLAEDNSRSRLRDLAPEALTPLAISEAAEAGDAIALRVVMETARYLAIGIVTCVHMLDPDSVVIGGGINFGGPGAALGDRFMQEVRTQATGRMIDVLRDKVHIGFATLGGDAGYLGAAGLARRDAARQA